MYFGWYIVGAGMAANAVVAGIATYGFTAMVNPIALTFGWSFAQISLAMTLRGAESGVFQPIIGYLADRFPARYLLLSGVTLCALGLIGMGFTANLFMFYTTFLIMALGVSLSTQLVPTTIVVRWFERDIGKAVSLLTIGIGLGGLFIPVVTQAIDHLGWRTALLLLAAIILAVGIPAAAIFRPPPQQASRPVHAGADGVSQRLGSVLGGIIGARAFWHIGIAMMCQVAALSPVMMHIMPYLVSIGIERTTASTIAMILPLVSIPARFIFGWLVDRYPVKNVMTFSVLLTAAGLFLLTVVSRTSMVSIFSFVVVYSFGLGGFSPLLPPAVRTYFRIEIFGTVMGLVSIFLTIGGIVTPLVAGIVYDHVGSYVPAWPAFGLTAVIGAGVMFTIPAPGPRESRVPQSG